MTPRPGVPASPRPVIPIFAFRGFRKMAKIGIFGGTFDPVHNAHLKVAGEFADAFALDKVLMMPAAVPPHREKPAASPRDRLHMLRLAVRDDRRLEVSDLEILRDGPSFTLDTLAEVRREVGPGLPWMALGSDAYSLIRSWYRPEEVLSHTHVVVLTRPGYDLDLMAPLPPGLSERYSLEEGVYVCEKGGTLRTLQVTPLDISSSMVREMISQGRDVRHLVPGAVFQYIQQKGLYRLPRT